MARIPLILSFLVLLPASAMAQNTWFVPDDFATIQAGIDGAQNGDTIIVRAGIYVENIKFNAKSIILESENGPTVTIIDGNQAGSAVTFNGNNILAAATLDGFTLTNGSGTFDAAANYYCGGGIYCIGSSPVITNNIISDNTSGFGGGISCRSASAAIVVENIITNNTAAAGGGISLVDSEIQISLNEISGNSAIAGNGGGIAAASSFMPNLLGNLIAGNRASFNGGGISCLETSPNIKRNTITANIAGNEGGGISFYGGCLPFIADTILWENNASVGKEMSIGGDPWPWGYSVVETYYSNVQGGQASIYVETGNTLYWLAGMIDADPDFVDPPGRDFHLQASSPCIDSGDPAGTSDPDGTRADMGALYYEQGGATLSVSNLIAGQTALIEVTNATPNNHSHFAWSVHGGGPISTPFGDAMLTPPYHLNLLQTDSTGYASYTANIPLHAAGVTVWCHGTDVGTQSMLNALMLVIQ